MLPFTDSFDTDRGWIAVDDGDLEDPSDWVLTTDGTANHVLAQRSNIYSGSPDGEGAIDKLGTLPYTGDPDWTDYDAS